MNKNVERQPGGPSRGRWNRWRWIFGKILALYCQSINSVNECALCHLQILLKSHNYDMMCIQVILIGIKWDMLGTFIFFMSFQLFRSANTAKINAEECLPWSDPAFTRLASHIIPYPQTFTVGSNHNDCLL